MRLCMVIGIGGAVVVHSMKRRHDARLVERRDLPDLRQMAGGVLVDSAGHLTNAQPCEAAPKAVEDGAFAWDLGVGVPGMCVVKRP